MKNNKKITLSILALLVFTTVFATLAYLSSATETLENVFTVGKINDPGLTEPHWPDVDPKDPEKPYEPEIIPGKIIPKDPTVTIGANSVDSYVYIAVKSKFVYEDQEGLQDAITYLYDGNTGFNKDWDEVKTIKDEKEILYIYRYKEDIKKSDSPVTLDPFFTDVKFDEELDSKIIELLPQTDSKQSILVKALVHQANIPEYENSEEALKYIDDQVIVFFSDKAKW